jgi:hypothetical protein
MTKKRHATGQQRQSDDGKEQEPVGQSAQRRVPAYQ